MNKAQRDDLKIKVAQHTGYALYHMSTGNLDTARQGLLVAQQRLQQLIDDEHDRARAERREQEHDIRVERREYENEIMEIDEKSEE